MDIQKLQAILMARGIRVADDDPLFLLVALNEAVLDDMSKKHLNAFKAVDQQVIQKLSSIVTSTVTEIAGKEAEARVAVATTKKAIWMIGGGLAWMGTFGLGVSYGAIYTTWTNPVWINHDGLVSVLSTALLKAPVGGFGCIAIALTLFFLQKNLTDSVAKNETDEAFMPIIVHLSATMFAVVGFWLSFLVMFR